MSNSTLPGLHDKLPKRDERIADLAFAYDKPYEYAERCLKFHNVKLPLPKFRTPDDGLNDFISDMTAHFDMTPSMTKQEFTDECDINVLMRRFQQTQDPSVLKFNTRVPIAANTFEYDDNGNKRPIVDLTNVSASYHEALNYVSDTKSEFMKLNADIRARFKNDPQEFLNFVANPANQEELIRMGLACRLS